jgi:hypothetical protein
MEISCEVQDLDYRCELVPPSERTIVLSINGDSREETWETLVERKDWGTFRDIVDFNPDDPEVQKAVDVAISELKVARNRAETHEEDRR